jgi:hypothetical protein
MLHTTQPTSLFAPAPKAPAALWARLWFRAAFSAGITLVWLGLALVAAARGDWLMMGIDIAATITGMAALIWAGHALLQLADAEGMALFACRLAEDRFDAILAQHLAEAERSQSGGWVQ